MGEKDTVAHQARAYEMLRATNQQKYKRICTEKTRAVGQRPRTYQLHFEPLCNCHRMC